MGEGAIEEIHKVDGWRQLCGDPDSNMMFTFHLHVAAGLSMQGLSDRLTKTSLLLLLSSIYSSTLTCNN